jgi:hypothetical protein
MDAFSCTRKGKMGTANQTDKSPPPVDSPAIDFLRRIATALENIAAGLDRRNDGMIAALPPEGLSKEDAARFVGVELATIEYLIRTRKVEYVQHGSQRGRTIPVESLRQFLKDFRQKVLNPPERNGKQRFLRPQ